MTAVRKGADFFLFQLMLLLCAIWGSQQVAIKLAADDIAPMLQVALRSGVAAVLVGLLLATEQPPALLLLVATTGNVLGSTANWLLGRYIEHLRHRRWFPVPEDKLQRTWQIGRASCRERV